MPPLSNFPTPVKCYYPKLLFDLILEAHLAALSPSLLISQGQASLLSHQCLPNVQHSKMPAVGTSVHAWCLVSQELQTARLRVQSQVNSMTLTEKEQRVEIPFSG